MEKKRELKIRLAIADFDKWSEIASKHDMGPSQCAKRIVDAILADPATGHEFIESLPKPALKPLPSHAMAALRVLSDEPFPRGLDGAIGLTPPEIKRAVKRMGTPPGLNTWACISALLQRNFIWARSDANGVFRVLSTPAGRLADAEARRHEKGLVK